MPYFPAPYSAISAISPAFERTRAFLFRPFRLWGFLKLALVAFLVENGGGGIGFNFGIPPTGRSGKTPVHVPHMPVLSPALMALVACVAVASIVIGIVVTYLVLRLRFAYFDRLLFMQREIAPGWRKYHRQAMRYLGMNLCFGLAVMVLLGGVGLLLWMKYKPMFAGMGPGKPLDFGDLLPLVLITFLVIFVMTVGIVIVDTILSYLVLPHMAIEDASIVEALREVWNDMTMEPGQFALFLLMRLLLPAAAMFVCILVLIIPMVVLIVAAVLVGVLLHKAFMPDSILFMTVMGTVGAIIGLGIFLPAMIAIGGTLGTFIRNYALLFYAGRYPALGALLWPPPVEPPAFSGSL